VFPFRVKQIDAEDEPKPISANHSIVSKSRQVLAGNGFPISTRKPGRPAVWRRFRLADRFPEGSGADGGVTIPEQPIFHLANSTMQLQKLSAPFPILPHLKPRTSSSTEGGYPSLPQI
jgi:hypothetical protein